MTFLAMLFLSFIFVKYGSGYVIPDPNDTGRLVYASRLVLFLLLAFLWIRLTFALTVRSAIRKGVFLCQKAVRQQNVAVIVGFSWGGAVVAEYLAREGAFMDSLSSEGVPSPSVLMIAPTTAAVSVVGFETDAALRVRTIMEQQFRGMATKSHLQPQVSSRIHVVHATSDRLFCPHPERWQELVELSPRGYFAYDVLADSHVLLRPSNLRRLTDILISLLQLKMKRGDSKMPDASGETEFLEISDSLSSGSELNTVELKNVPRGGSVQRQSESRSKQFV